MNRDLLNILSNSNKDIDNQKLMDYLTGKLSDEEKHEVEKALADNDFLNDAAEGLEHFRNQHNLGSYVDQLNKDLHRQLREKKQRREKRKIKDTPWLYFAVILILTLIVLAYVVISKLK